MLKNYSKPVLTPFENSAYKPEYKFDLVKTSEKLLSDRLNVSFSLNCTSNILNRILKEKASIFLKIRGNLKSRTVLVDDLTNIDVDVMKDDLDSDDNIHFTAYAICTTDFKFPWTSELKDVYDPMLVFNFHKNEILAESEDITISYKSVGDSFIHLITSESLNGKGLRFDIKKPNMIQIKAGTNFKDAFSKLHVNNKKVYSGKTVDAFLIYDAILYSVLEMVQSGSVSEYKEKEWFKALDYCFDDERYQNFEDFINSMIDNFDVEQIFTICQNLISNAIENFVIESLEN